MLSLGATYLEELQVLGAAKLLKELDALDGVGVGVDGEEVLQVTDAVDGLDLVLFQVQVLQVLVLLQLSAKVRNFGLLDRQGGECVRAAICCHRVIAS